MLCDPLRQLRLMVLCIVCAAALGGPIAGTNAWAGVLVLDNRSNQTVQFSLQPTWQGQARYSLAPSRQISLQVPEAVELEFQSGQAMIRRRVGPNTLHEFYGRENYVDMRPILFSVGPWPQPGRLTDPPAPVVVPVKLVADEGYPGGKAAWEPLLKAQLETASRYFETDCGVRFQVAAAETWRPEGPMPDAGNVEAAKKAFAAAVEALGRVTPEPGWLVVGVVGGLNAPAAAVHQARQPLFSHLLLPDVQKDFTREQQLDLLLHDLGHFLGAVHSPEPGSIMRANPWQTSPRGPDRGMDGPNALVVNVMADELRSSNKRAMEAMPRSSREYLRSIYREMATRLPADREIPRYAELIREPVLPDLRYVAQWVDGTRMAAATVGPWASHPASPKLGGRELFDAKIPLRWLVDNSLTLAPPPESWVEFAGGDCLPGRVVAFRDGAEPPGERLPPHLLVVPGLRIDLPEAPVRGHLRVTTDWLRRIVWQRVTDRYQPRTLFFADGRQLEFRSLRFAGTMLQLLRDDGVREVPMGEAAELHLPPLDPWEAYFEQLTALAPKDSARVVRLETNNGLRATSSTERYRAHSQGPAERPASWYHLVQPAWSVDAMWLAHESIRVRQYFLPHEVPLSRIEPSRIRQQSDLGGVWRWQADRNVEGGLLESGGIGAAWGFGVHALSELEFPLPPAARAFQTRLGLDHLAGNGGCVRASVLLESVRKPLFASPLLIGSAQTQDTGRLTLEPATAARRLTLLVDPASREGPPGTDPLDIRDTFDWLEPLVELDPQVVQAEVLRRGVRAIAAWQNWSVQSGDASAVRLVTFQDDPSQHAAPRFRVAVSTAQGPLRVAGKLTPRPYRDRMLVSVGRPPQSPPSRLEIRVDGKIVGTFDVPPRYAGEPPPIAVSLAQYHGQPVKIDLIQHSPDEQALVEWRAIWLVGRGLTP